MYSQGFIKVAAASPVLRTGDTKFNVSEILKCLQEVKAKKVDIVVFPELCLCGYSIGDLAFQEYLYNDCLNALDYLLKNNDYEGVIIVGSVIKIEDRIFNCSIVIQENEILGIVPKSYIPNNPEFSEGRWFVSGNEYFCDICVDQGQ